MKTNPHMWPRFVAILACIALAAPLARGQVRTSTDYEVACESADSSGARQGSDGAGSYVVDASIGGIGGLSTAAAPATQAKQGYAGQLYDLVGLDVSAAPASLDENTTRQMEAAGVCDDATILNLDESVVGWSVVSGPIDSISISGLATAGSVYENTGATVEGSHLGLVDDFVLTVLNIGRDDYKSYAADGIDDDWQVLYFGEENPDAGPGENPDFDPDDNFREFMTGFDPTDPQDWFGVRIYLPSDTTAEFELNKAIPGRTYRLVAGTDLQTYPETVATFSVASEEAPKVVMDPDASGSGKIYRIEVERSGE